MSDSRARALAQKINAYLNPIYNIGTEKLTEMILEYFPEPEGDRCPHNDQLVRGDGVIEKCMICGASYVDGKWTRPLPAAPKKPDTSKKENL